jgi:HK97 family phage portal protein
MGLGKLIAPAATAQHRAVGEGGIRYEVYDIATDAHLDTFSVSGGVAPDWPTSAYKNGMSVPGAWRASLLLSGLLAGSPWRAYRKGSGGDPAPRLISPTPPLLEQPAPPDIRFTTFRSLALDYLWEGNAIGVYASRDRYGWPTAIVPVPASSVMVRRVTERNYPLPIGTIEYLIGAMSFTANEVLHIKGPCAPGELRGMGVLEAHLGTLRGAQQLSSDAHSTKGVPTGVLKSENPDLTKTEAEDLKRKWLDSQRNRSIAVLNSTTSFEALAWNPRDAQLIEARTFSLTELELIFGLPVGWLGGNTNARVYKNIEQDAVNLLKFTLGDHLAVFKETLSTAFPRGTFIEPDLDALLASDTVTRYQAYATATGNKPWLLPSEVRTREKLAAVEGIDDMPAATPATQGAPSDPGVPTDTTDAEIEEIQR